MVLSMKIMVGSPSEAWRALAKMAAQAKDANSDEAKKELKGLGIGSNKTTREYVAWVNAIL